MENSKLSASQIKYLLAIYGKGTSGASISEIAAALGVSKPSAYKMVMLLLSMGLVEKEFYGEIITTKKGLETAEKIEKDYLQVLYFFVEKLGLSFEAANDDALNFVTCMSQELVRAFVDLIRKGIEIVEGKETIEQPYLGFGDVAEDDGSYEVPFKILMQNESRVSMSNKAFEHPCYIEVQDGKMVVKLKAKNIVHRSIQHA